jgi:hypothetical protein
MMNSDLMRSVTDAARELCCGNADLKGRLLLAVRALNVVLIRKEDWPAILRVRLHRQKQEADAMRRLPVC